MSEHAFFRALALQVCCRAINHAPDTAAARLIIRETIDRLAGQVPASLAFIGRDVRLVVLPEYFLTGYPLGESIESWSEKAALEIDGPEYERLGRIAQDNGIFLSGNAYERDPNFPSLYFQTSFILGPNGNVVLRYRRLNSMFAPTPHDVWDRYVDVYGLEAVFPVAKTEIGALAAIASEEILFPEVARCLAMRGAEVFVHSSSEMFAKGMTPKDAAKLSRAVENIAYVVSANSGGITGTPLPAASADGGSKIVDYRGLVIAEAMAGENMTAYAEIDLAALRRARSRPGLMNLLIRQRFELYAESYRRFSFYPPNTFADGIPQRNHFIATQQATIDRLKQAGVIPE